jgi:hypothetical protein
VLIAHIQNKFDLKKLKERQDRKQQLKDKKSPATTAKTIEELKENAEKQQRNFDESQEFAKSDAIMNEVVDDEVENSAKTFYKEFKKVRKKNIFRFFLIADFGQYTRIYLFIQIQLL